MANKMTYASALSFVLTNCADLPTDVREKLVALSDSYAKKASAEKKPTKVQTENENVKQNMLKALRDSNAPMTATEVAQAVGCSVQKASALLAQMVKDAQVERVPEKRKTYFRAA